MFKRIRLILTCCIVLISNSIYSQCINVFPFLEDFEAGQGGWISGGGNSDWTWGTPAKTRINSAGSGNSCWISGGLSNPSYNGGQKSWIQSPCFDFSNLSRPLVKFMVFWDTERQYDGGNLQYSVNAGGSWQNVGFNSINTDCKTLNWFNSPNITNLSGLASPTTGWSGSTLPNNGSCLGGNGSGQWLPASYCLSTLAGLPNVIFRFTFCSGTSCNSYDGLAIDSFSISNLTEPVLDFTYTCESSDRVRFVANGGECPSSQSWNFGDPNSANNTSSNLTDVHTFSGPGIYEVSFTINEPCIGTFVKKRRVIIPEIESEIFSVSCSGADDGAIQLSIPSYQNLTIIWNTSPSQSADSIGMLAPGIYQVTVNADSACTQVKSFTVEVDGDGGPRPSLPTDVLFCGGDVIQISPGVFNNYLWSDGSTEENLLVTDTGWYSVTVTDISGCSGADSLYVRERCFTDVFVPSAFTPNDDGINDIFRTYSGEVLDYSIRIFNKYGQELFSSNQQEMGWDGSFEKEDCQNDLYVWLLKYRGPDLKKRTERGIVHLYR